MRRADYAERVVRGGFPESMARTQARRREQFLHSYVADLISRDVNQLSEIERTGEIRAFIRLLATRSGQLLVASALAATSGSRTGR